MFPTNAVLTMPLVESVKSYELEPRKGFGGRDAGGREDRPRPCSGSSRKTPKRSSVPWADQETDELIRQAEAIDESLTIVHSISG
jgi:hypothetical protein